MSVAVAETYVYTTIYLPNWEATIPVAYLKGRRNEQYLPFRLLCEVIGVERKRQLATIKARYLSAIKSLPLDSATGAHMALWIHRPECVTWMRSINPARCKISQRGPLEKFRADLAEAADKLIFSDPQTQPAKRGMFAHSDRHEYVFSCLYCGGGHRILAQNGEVTLEKYEY